MLALKSKQSNAMSNINALLSDETVLDLTSKIDLELGNLSIVQLKMQQCQEFILQMNKAEEELNNKLKKDDNNS